MTAAPHPDRPLAGLEAHPGLRARWAAFDHLGLADLYALLQLRVDVFVVEQACPYREIDGRDPDARHLLVEDSDTGRLVAALRLFPPAEPPAGDGCSHLGRIVTRADRRGAGLGRALVVEGLAECARHHTAHPVRLAAQAHLADFYARLGFRVISDVYDEDGIAHVDMERPPADPPR